VGDKDSEGGAYCNLGHAYVKLGNFQEAIECENNCMWIAKEVGDRGLEAAAYGNLGNAYEGLGNFQKAVKYHSETHVIGKEMGDRYKEGQANCNLDNAYFKQQESRKSERMACRPTFTPCHIFCILSLGPKHPPSPPPFPHPQPPNLKRYNFISKRQLINAKKETKRKKTSSVEVG